MAATAARGRRLQFDPWPGYVDVLSTLLMVVIFVLMVFVISQVFLSRALSGRDEALARLNLQVAELSELLSMEQKATADLRLTVGDLSSQLQSANAARDESQQRLTVLLGQRDSLAAGLADANQQLADADDAKSKLESRLTLLLRNSESDKAALALLRAEMDKAYQLADENKTALLAALAQVEQSKKTAAETEAALKASLAAALADAEKNRQSAATDKATLDAKLAELESAFKTISADKEKIDTMLAEIAALRLARDELAKSAADRQTALDQRAAEIEQAYESIAADKAKIDTMLAEIAALEKLREDLAKQVVDSQAALAAAESERDQAYATTAEQKAAIEARLVELEQAYKVIDADKARIQALLGDIAALESLRDDLAKNLAASQEQVTTEKKLSDSAQLQVNLLNQQILALRQQLAQVAAALEVSEAKAKEQGVQIADLGQRLNAALANKVAELAGYRSEFFGKLRQVLGDRPDIQVVGDRFVFQSEVLFDVASSRIGLDGQAQLAQFAKTLLEIAATIPPDIDWILRVDGHTDRSPMRSGSNWDLSAARAIAVVNYLASQGVPQDRLVAAGFAEFRPLDPGRDEIAYRRNRRIELKLDQR